MREGEGKKRVFLNLSKEIFCSTNKEVYGEKCLFLSVMKKYLFIFYFLSFFGSTLAFTDVPKNDPQFEGIRYLESVGAVEGYGDGTFGIAQPVSRVEFLKILLESDTEYKYSTAFEECQSEVQKNNFPDVEQSDWFHEYVCYAVKKSLVKGYGDGFFRPYNNVSYAEAAKILARMNNPRLEEGEPWHTTFIAYIEEREMKPFYHRDPYTPITRGDVAEMIWKRFITQHGEPHFYNAINFPLGFYYYDYGESESTRVFEEENKILVAAEDHGLHCPGYGTCFEKNGTTYFLLNSISAYPIEESVEKTIQDLIEVSGGDASDCTVEKPTIYVHKKEGLENWQIQMSNNEKYRQRDNELIEEARGDVSDIYKGRYWTIQQEFCSPYSTGIFLEFDGSDMLYYTEYRSSHGMGWGNIYPPSITLLEK